MDTASPPVAGPGLLRRARRRTGLSQRGLAARLGVSQSTVARWETGETSPDLATVQRLAELAGLRLVALDDADAEIAPMRADAARDRAGRRYPAHLDIHAQEWWVPPGLHLSNEWYLAWRDSAARQEPRVRFEHAAWRDLLRGLVGVPDDHATTAELVAEVHRRLTETSHPPPTAAD